MIQGPNFNPIDRSYAEITFAHLERLKDLALNDLELLFARKPRSARYKNSLRAICLAQGAAQHFRDGRNGVKDFDVWCFFKSVVGEKFPSRRVGHADFGPSEHGSWPGDEGRFSGRRVDIMGRDIPLISKDVFDDIIVWLETDVNKSPRLLRQQSLIAIWPKERLGETIWST